MGVNCINELGSHARDLACVESGVDGVWDQHRENLAGHQTVSESVFPVADHSPVHCYTRTHSQYTTSLHLHHTTSCLEQLTYILHIACTQCIDAAYCYGW